MGTINSIEQVVLKISSPAIIVIGEVVRDCKKSDRFYEELSISSKQVVYGKEIVSCFSKAQ
jgi:uroporphyrin-III C-methyltransferase